MKERKKSFNVTNFFREIIENRIRGTIKGVTSICSYNEYVIESGLLLSKRVSAPILIETTCNQVNQYGGYTRLTPQNFLKLLIGMAKKLGFPPEKIIYGGDHLGPFPFRNEPADIAMKKAEEMVSFYVKAGAKKLHIDTSMPLGGDRINKNGKLDIELIAERCGKLCFAAEKTFRTSSVGMSKSDKPDLLYVIGTDVPAPGGSDEVEKGLKPTTLDEFKETVDATEYSFKKLGLQDAWERVIGIVIQPGVEYGDHTVVEYNRKNTEELKKGLSYFPNLVFEGHSTDYQTEKCLSEMVEDGIAILKVGPQLSFTLRETLFLFDIIESEIFKKFGNEAESTKLIERIENHLFSNPEHWKNQYNGTEKEIRFKIKYSFFDRIRYYLKDPEIKNAINTLLENLKNYTIPLSLYSQFLPVQYQKIRNGLLNPEPHEIIIDRIADVLKSYYRATGYEI